ncbi:hypothetical protein CR513_08689, partial [Mucuna pruriens]
MTDTLRTYFSIAEELSKRDWPPRWPDYRKPSTCEDVNRPTSKNLPRKRKMGSLRRLWELEQAREVRQKVHQFLKQETNSAVKLLIKTLAFVSNVNQYLSHVEQVQRIE